MYITVSIYIWTTIYPGTVASQIRKSVLNPEISSDSRLVILYKIKYMEQADDAILLSLSG